MRAAVITSLAGPDAVEVQDVSLPQSSSGGVLIDVAFAGVSFPDVLYTRGEYQVKPELPFIPGWEVSGIVQQDAGEFKAGERVAAVSRVGGFADVVLVDQGMVFRVPEHVSLEKAAALPLNYLTASFALLQRARLAAGEIVLVHGAAGGVGSAVCQLATAWGGHVIAVVSTYDKLRFMHRAGVRDAVLAENFRECVSQMTGGRGVDVVVDPVGGDRFTDSLRSLAPGGRLLVVGFTGRTVPTVKVNRLLLSNTSVMGVGVGEHWRREPDSAGRHWDGLVPHLASRRLDPPISAIHDLADVKVALARMESRQTKGKTLLRLAAGR